MSAHTHRLVLPLIIASCITPLCFAAEPIAATASPLIINAWNKKLYIPENSNSDGTENTGEAASTGMNLDNDAGCQGYQVRLIAPTDNNSENEDDVDIDDGIAVAPNQNLTVSIDNDDDDTAPFCNFTIQDSPNKPSFACYLTIRKDGSFDLNSHFCVRKNHSTTPIPKPHISDYITAFSLPATPTQSHS